MQCPPGNKIYAQECKQQNERHKSKGDKRQQQRMTHHRMTRHRMTRHRMPAESRKPLADSALPDGIFREQKSDLFRFTRVLPCSTPKPLVRRELRPPLEGRSVNQQSNEPFPHSKRRHRRGKRSLTQQLIHTCNRRQRRSEHRKEFRRMRACWKALARLSARLSLAQERWPKLNPLNL